MYISHLPTYISHIYIDTLYVYHFTHSTNIHTFLYVYFTPSYIYFTHSTYIDTLYVYHFTHSTNIHTFLYVYFTPSYIYFTHSTYIDTLYIYHFTHSTNICTFLYVYFTHSCDIPHISTRPDPIAISLFASNFISHNGISDSVSDILHKTVHSPSNQNLFGAHEVWGGVKFVCLVKNFKTISVVLLTSPRRA